MKRLISWVRNFFGFSKRETNAFIILLPLMFVLIFSEPIYRHWFVGRPEDFSRETKTLDSLLTELKWKKKDSVVKIIPETKLFSFNPNSVSNEELLQLGFKPSIANRIVNYRLKGGKFLIKNDLKKIYGMDSSFFNTLIPFIQLPENVVKQKQELKTEKAIAKTGTSFQKFDLNTADTLQLKLIYGIGSKLSARIVTYREMLGGFISFSQLKEVYGLDSVVINNLKSKSFVTENFTPKQININSASEKELGAHPYIKFKVAKAISAYRFQHGKFLLIDDLKKIALIDEAKFIKMQPYVRID